MMPIAAARQQDPDHPAIDGYDDPNANPPTNSVSTIINSLPRPDHYTGAGGTPSVQNGYASLGETMTTPTGLKSLIDAMKTTRGKQGDILRLLQRRIVQSGTYTYETLSYLRGQKPSLDGNGTGYGILVVTGTLTMSGNFTWYGLVLVVGDGNMQFNGGGNGQIQGMMVDANIWDNHTSPKPSAQPSAPRHSDGTAAAATASSMIIA